MQIQVVEGELEGINIFGLKRLQAGYVRSRIERLAGRPLNQKRLEEALQLLQIDPLIERVNAELTAGSVPGNNILQVTITEAPAFHAGIVFANNQSPSVGSDWTLDKKVICTQLSCGLKSRHHKSPQLLF